MRLFGGLLVMPEFEFSIGVCAVKAFLIEPARLSALKAEAAIIPVSEDLWLGGPIGRAVRDACGDIVQDRARTYEPLARGKAVSVRAGRGPVRHVILANIYDDNKLTSEALMGEALDAAMAEVSRIRALSLLIPDFTAEFNYFTRRSDAEPAAKAIVGALSRNESTARLAKIAVFDRDALATYRRVMSGGADATLAGAY